MDDAPTNAIRHRFGYEAALRPFAYAVGAVPSRTYVEVDDERIVVRFGPWCLRTTIGNVAGFEQTGPYSFPKVAGPPHLSLVDRGITFATNRQQGVCIRFREPVAGIEPTGRLRHPAATVTVADPTVLTAQLAGLTERPASAGARRLR
jgi:hypothetical protein